VQPTGVIGGKLYEVDCVIFATGFEVFSPTFVTGDDTVTVLAGSHCRTSGARECPRCTAC
jgi:hypothetical protein